MPYNEANYDDPELSQWLAQIADDDRISDRAVAMAHVMAGYAHRAPDGEWVMELTPEAETHLKRVLAGLS